MIIEPTVGRVVWFRPVLGQHQGFSHGDQPFAATVVYVHSNRMVNLVVFDHEGFSYARTSVPLLQEGDEKPQGMYCEWMPYQLGQAKKHAEPSQG